VPIIWRAERHRQPKPRHARRADHSATPLAIPGAARQ
jgi:hypothetical protein